jgi:hypothetical protein
MRYKDIIAGETYRIREWDDMANEYGVKQGLGGPYIDIPGPKFTNSMRPLCGMEVAVRRKHGSYDDGRVMLYYPSVWNFSCHMLEPLEPVDDTTGISLGFDKFAENILKL